MAACTLALPVHVPAKNSDSSLFQLKADPMKKATTAFKRTDKITTMMHPCITSHEVFSKVTVVPIKQNKKGLKIAQMYFKLDS
jgi:hypothetical protein